MPDSEAEYLMAQLTKFRKGEIVVQQSIQSDKDKTMLLRRNTRTGKIEAVEENKTVVDRLSKQVENSNKHRKTSTFSATSTPRNSVKSDSGNDERSFGSLSPRNSSVSSVWDPTVPISSATTSRNSLPEKKRTAFPWVQEKRNTLPASADFQSKLENNLKRQADVKNASQVLPNIGSREIAAILEETHISTYSMDLPPPPASLLNN